MQPLAEDAGKVVADVVAGAPPADTAADVVAVAQEAAKLWWYWGLADLGQRTDTRYHYACPPGPGQTPAPPGPATGAKQKTDGEIWRDHLGGMICSLCRQFEVADAPSPAASVQPN